MAGPPFSFAFQPIVDTDTQGVFAYEALIRGPTAQGASQVFAQVAAGELHGFDHLARLEAVRLAAALDLRTRLSLNILPGSLTSMPDCLDILVDHALRAALGSQQLLLEVTEGELIERPAEFAQRLNRYRTTGLQLAIDDFGAGYSGLNLLADFQPDLIKLDMHLLRGIDRAGPRQAIVRGILQVCEDLGIEVIAEGVETLEEYQWCRRIGIRLFQGYLFARPAFQALPTPLFPQAPTAGCAIAGPRHREP